MRETGPIAKDLHGEEAMPYIGFARTLLGQLKSDMQFGDMKFGKRAKVLEDGTTVVAISAWGIDKIRIIAGQEPPPPWTPPEIEEPVVLPPEEPEWKLRADELDDKVVRVCGNTGSGAWVWSPGEPAVTMLPLAAGCDVARTYAISGDGSIVVGTCFSTTDGDNVVAVRWHRGEGGWGAEVLGGPREGFMEAVSISEDGAVIGGHGYVGSALVPFGVTTADTPARQWTWTRESGITVLPNSHLPQGETGAVVSPDAAWVGGNVQWFVSKHIWDFSFPDVVPKMLTWDNVVPEEVNFMTTSASKVATWRRDGGGSYAGETVRYDGFSFTTHSIATYPAAPDQVFTYANQNEARVRGIANDGTFVGELNAQYGFVCNGGAYTYYNQPKRDQLDEDTNDSEIPRCISADAKRIAGVTYSYNDDEDQAWVRTDGVKRSLGPGGVNAITADGDWMAGYSGNDAVYWPYRTGTARTIPSVGGFMEATGIGRLRIQIDEEGAPTVTTKNLTF